MTILVTITTAATTAAITPRIMIFIIGTDTDPTAISAIGDRVIGTGRQASAATDTGRTMTASGTGKTGPLLTVK